MQSTEPAAESRRALVEYEHCAVQICKFTDTLKETRSGRLGTLNLHDDDADIRVGLENPPQGVEIVVGERVTGAA